MGSAPLTHDRRASARADLWEALAARGTPLRIWAGDRFRDASWDQCASEATRVGVGLRRRGIEPGDRVACVLTNSPALVPVLLGTWLAGGVVVSLPLPGRSDALPAYGARLARSVASADARLLVVEPRLATALGPGIAVTAADALAAPGPLEPTPPIGSKPALIQYSSGSTGSPKGCVLSARAIVTQIDVLGRTLGIGPGDRIVSWLPLSHDMGLFGALLMGWMRGAAPTIATPERFLAAPATWMRDCVDAQATYTVVPSFGLRIAARGARPRGSFPLRGCIIGSDRIELSVLEQTAALFGPCGMTHATLAPAYGLAEATLAVTATAPGDGPTAATVNAEALLAGEVHDAEPDGATTTLVACGRPIDGVRVRIAGDVGEILVRSPSLADGYASDPARTAAAFVGGELHTGDIGFMRDARLYVMSRNDDVMAVRGRKVHAGELEAQLGRLPGVRAGRCAVVEALRGDRSRIVVLAEPDESANHLRRLAHDVRDVIVRRAGVGVDELRFVARGSLPRTPSGKLRRFACRQLAAAPPDNDVTRVVFDRPRRGNRK